MSKTKHSDRLYPVEMSWAKLMWVVQVGDRVYSPEGESYRVSRVTILPIARQPPILELSKEGKE